MKNRKIVLYLFLVLSLVLALCPYHKAFADDDSLILNEYSISLIPGDSFELKICDESFEGLEDWLVDYNRPSFYSSDENVCTVDSKGIITAVGCGSCVITAECTGMKAECSVFVKLTGAMINKKSLTLYEGDSEYLWLSMAVTAVSRSFKVTDANSGKDATDCFYINKQNSEGYSFEAKKGGEYYIDLFAYDGEGKSYSGRCYVSVITSGLVSEEVAVAVDGTVEIPFIRSQIKTFEYIKDADLGKEEKGSTKYSIYEASDGRRYCKLTGVKAGTSVAGISYVTDAGVERTSKIYIRVTEPEVKQFEGYLVYGKEYTPEITGIRKCSTVYGAVRDESVISVENRASQNIVFIPQGLGAVKIAVVVDGKQFVQTVKCINPVSNIENVLIKKGKTKKIKISGIPDTMTVKYKSSDKTVATVTKKGKIKAVSEGSCVITAKVNGQVTLKIKVTVGKKYTLKAVFAAEKLLGSAYSQKFRMSPGYYDCSSLVWRVYKSVGAPLTEGDNAPVAADLAEILEAKGKVIARGFVSADVLQPGDLIFYAGTTDNGRYMNICHVAMYYGENKHKVGSKTVNTGKIIHANSCVEFGDYSGFRVNRIVLIIRPQFK